MPNKSRKSKRKPKTYCFYECPECTSKWMKAISGSDFDVKCRNCNIVVEPYKQTSEPEVDPNRRCFGCYKCTGCSRTWMSANSWVGYSQQCQICKINIMAHIQTPLRPNRGGGGDNKKPHLSDLCGKCKSLGRSCRQKKN